MTSQSQYSFTQNQYQERQREYRQNYPPFKKYCLRDDQKRHVSDLFATILESQNGPDFDDYVVNSDNKIVKYLSQIPKGKLLLLGVGTGHEIRLAKDFGFDAYGITLGSRNVEYAKRYIGLSDKDIFECALEALPFGNNTFDCVAGFQVFEHAISPIIFLLEQRRVLKIGGSLVLEWPSPSNKSTDGANNHHQICYLPGQAVGLLQKARFSNIVMNYSDMATVPTEEYWISNQSKNLLIYGQKKKSDIGYIQD